MLSLSRSEIDRYLSRMELRRQGFLSQLCDRLNKWVLGIYVPHNSPGGQRSEKSSSEGSSLRKTFVQISVWDIHPLEVVVKSEEILEILEDDGGGRVYASTPTVLKEPGARAAPSRRPGDAPKQRRQ